MSFADYTSLQSEISDYLARGDLTDKIPSFIRLCEAKLNRILTCKDMEQRSTATIDIASDEPEFLSLPTDFQAMRRIRLSNIASKPRLEFATQAYIDDKRSSSGNVTGQPRWFTVMGSELELFPTPDAAYVLEMIYRKQIPALADNDTNWLLVTHPDAYLYGALLEAEPYMKNDGRIATWSQALASVVDQINTNSQIAAFNAGPLSIQLRTQTP
jgi:hypothetical protein